MSKNKFNAKKTIIISLVVALMFVLLMPKYDIYKDGGTKMYSSLIYKVILWNSMDESAEGGYKTGTEVYFFPNNFKSLDEYR